MPLPTPLRRAPTSGDFRQPYGSDILQFHGSTAASVAQRPKLVLTVSGPGPTVNPPPFVSFPLSPRGRVVDGGADYIEVTCDGGTRRARACLSTCCAPLCVGVCAGVSVRGRSCVSPRSMAACDSGGNNRGKNFRRTQPHALCSLAHV